MTAVLNISQQNFGSSKKLPMFVTPNTVDEHVNQLKYSNRFNTAEFLRQFYVSSLAVFGDIQGSSVSFVIHINQIFGLKMPNTDKNLKKTAQGASCSTANTRNSVKSVRQSSTVTSSSAVIAPKLYQITMDMVATYDDPAGRVRHCGIIHTDIYQASSENEALGLALSVVRNKYGSFHSIDLNSIKRTQTYNPSKF